jgi:hypothetical protein
VFSPELVVFINKDTPQLIKDLCDLFDCGSEWTYKTKNKGTSVIEGVWLNLIGATTPELIQLALPQETIGGGFASRVIYVYGDTKSKIVPFPILSEEEKLLRTNLIIDMEHIRSLSGEFRMHEDFLISYGEWYVEHCQKPALADHQLASYLERRPTHLRKLAMIMSVSARDDMVLLPEDFTRSLDLLVRTEANMPKVYRAHGRSNVADLFPRLLGTIAAKRKVKYSALLSSFYRDVSDEELRDMLRTLSSMGTIKLERIEGEMDLYVVFQRDPLD